MNKLIVYSTSRICQMAVINLTAWVLIVLGLGFLGLAPALSACLYATKQPHNGNYRGLVATMWSEYCKEFWRANLLALPLFAVLFSLFHLASFIDGTGFIAILVISLFITGFTLATLIAISRYNTTMSDTLHNAMTSYLSNPHCYLLAICTIPLFLWLTWQQHLFGVYFGFSTYCLLANHLITATFKVELPRSEQNHFMGHSGEKT